MTQSIEDRIAAAVDRPRTVTVEVCSSGGLVDLHTELVVELGAVIDDANKNRSIANGGDPRIDEIHEQITKVEQAMVDHTDSYEVRPVGALAWNNLLREHPPRRGIDKNGFNLDTFPPAIVAACVDGMTDERAAELYESLPSAEWNKLFNAAWVVNEAETPRPKLPADIENLLQSVRSSITAANEE